MKQKSTLVFIYNSFQDPLFQNLVLAYIKTLSQQNPQYAFHLITFEQSDYSLTKEEISKTRGALIKYRIYWYPLKFHTGRFLLLKKAYDFGRGMLQVAWLRARYDTRLIFAFANISAAFSFVLSRILGMKFMVYSYEPHSEFMAELGGWSRKSLKYMILNKLETYAGLKGEYILTGTQYMVDYLATHGATGKIYRAPTSVDETKFTFREDERKKLRAKLGVENRPVLLYLGKFGGLYYSEETIYQFKYLQKFIPELFFLIVTPSDKDEILSWLKKADIRDKDFHLTGPHKEVVPYICAADIGLNAIPPSPAQKFRSPTKVAEYLLCGLPYITCRGISEDDIIAEKYHVGAVINDFGKDSVKKIIPQLHVLLNEDKLKQIDRCRKAGIMYRGKSNIDQLLTGIYEEVF